MFHRWRTAPAHRGPGRRPRRYFRDDADIDYYELYDLQADPDELNNIYGKPGTEKVTKQLLKRLREYRKELKVDE